MKRKIQQLIASPYISGSIFLTLSNIIVSFSNYFYNVLAGRSLGPQGYGELGALFSYLTILLTPITIISTIIIQKIGKSGDQALSLTQAIEQWVVLRLKRWFLIGIVLVLVIPVIPTLTHLSFYSSITLVLLVLSAFVGVFYGSALQGLHFFFITALISVIAAVIKLIGPVLVTFGIGGYVTIIGFVLLSSTFGLVVSYMKVHSVVNQHTVKKSPLPKKRLLHILFQPYLWLSSFSLMSIVLINNFDIIFVKRMFNANEAGVYVAWSLFSKMILYALGPISSISFIFFSSVKERNKHSIILILLILLIFCIGIGSFIIYSYYPQVVLNLVFGTKFSMIIPYLPIASFLGTSFAILTILNNYFLARNDKRALCVFISLPFYILGLILFHQNIQEVMYVITAITSSLVVIILLMQLVIMSKSWIIHNNGTI